MFSPYYFTARRRGAGDPLNHCALNVALYGDGGGRWAMTERGRGSLRRSAALLSIGPSAMSWDGDALSVQIDELSVPLPSRIRGQVRVFPSALANHSVVLDAEGHHMWSPIAPCARVEVDLQSPALRWSGQGYFDSNAGDAPLEDAFARWDWSRAGLRRGTAVLYDVVHSDGTQRSLATRFDPSGSVEHFEPPGAVRLPRTRWRVQRGTRADDAAAARVMRTLEDAPFYARTVLTTRLLGEEALAMHESLCLDRFRAGWVRMLLPFRMPRRR